MTEAEAKTKWCPFTRATDETGKQPGSNRTGSDWDYSAYQCIASGCMAWRWGQTIDGPVIETKSMVYDYHGVFKVAYKEGWRVKKPGDRDGRGGELERVELIKTGYCGLAGKP